MNKEEKKRFQAEIEILKISNSPYVVKTYGAILLKNEVSCCMEFMDIGSLDVILYKINRIPERILSKIIRHVC